MSIFKKHLFIREESPKQTSELFLFTLDIKEKSILRDQDHLNRPAKSDNWNTINRNKIFLFP